MYGKCTAGGISSGNKSRADKITLLKGRRSEKTEDYIESVVTVSLEEFVETNID